MLPTSVQWDTSKGGADFGYLVSGGAVTKDTQEALYWSKSNQFTDAIGGSVYSNDIPAGTATGSYGPFNATASQLGPPPKEATDLLVVTDPDNVLGNFDPSKNVVALAYIPEWTGDGSDNLWSDGLNWLGGFVPQAGDNLLFPTGAKQLSSDNDLGLSFGSITIQDSYEFSGQTLTATGPVDVQQGSTVLDCSATDSDTTTVETGASLTVGTGATLTTAGPTTVQATANLTIDDGATLDVLSTDPFTMNGNWSLLTNSTCNVAGNASVASTGQLNAAAQCQMSLQANSTVNFAGTETFADGSVLNAYANANLNLLANGTANLNGTATLNSLSNLNLLANTTLNSSGSLTADSNSTVNVDFGATLQQQSGSNYYFYGTAKDGGIWNVATGANVYQYSGSSYEVAATLNNSGNWTFQSAADFASGAQLTIDASGKTLNDGHFNVGFHDTLIDSGSFQSGVGGTVNDQGKISIVAGATWKDGDAITVAAGATLDVSGNLTEAAGGDLDVSGTVTIEPGASLNNLTTITIEAGGLLDVLGALAVAQVGSLNIFGKVTVENGATYSSQGKVTVEYGGAFNQPNASSTSTALTLSSSNPTAGVDVVTLTATITGHGSSNAIPTGTVDFFDTTTGSDLGGAGLVNGVASLSAGPFAAGTHSITATYSSDNNFQSSAGTGSLAAQTPVSPPVTVATATPPSPIQAVISVYLDGIEYGIDLLLGDDTTAVLADLAANMPFAGPFGLLTELAGIEAVLEAVVEGINT